MDGTCKQLTGIYKHQVFHHQVTKMSVLHPLMIPPQKLKRMSEAYNVKCKRMTYKPANSSRNLAGNREELGKACTLLYEQIFQWHSPFPYENVHKNMRQKPDWSYINYYSSSKMLQVLIMVNKTMQKRTKTYLPKLAVTQQKSASCMTATFMVWKIMKLDKNISVDSFLVSAVLRVGVRAGFHKT